MSQHRVIDFMHGISGGSEVPSSRMASLKADTHLDMVGTLDNEGLREARHHHHFYS